MKVMIVEVIVSLSLYAYLLLSVPTPPSSSRSGIKMISVEIEGMIDCSKQ